MFVSVYDAIALRENRCYICFSDELLTSRKNKLEEWHPDRGATGIAVPRACGHALHLKCLKQLLKGNRTSCPVCRNPHWFDEVERRNFCRAEPSFLWGSASKVGRFFLSHLLAIVLAMDALFAKRLR